MLNRLDPQQLDKANKRKRGKYGELVEQCSSNSQGCEPLDVGCRGLVGQQHHRSKEAKGHKECHRGN